MALDATVSGLQSNSYITVAEADAYFANTLRKDSWMAVSSKEAALCDATSYLDVFDWLGSKSVNEQSLAHPRSGLGGYSSDDIAKPIKDAACELALYLVENSDSFTEKDTTTMVKVAVIQIEKKLKEFGSYSSLPLRVKRLIGQFLAKKSNDFKLQRA